MTQEKLTLPEAADELHNLIFYGYSASSTRKGNAIRLGLQAIQRLIGLRTTRFHKVSDLLPGEAGSPTTTPYTPARYLRKKGVKHVALPK